MGLKKQKKRFEECFGKIPDPMYFPGDIAQIQSYFEFCRKQHPDAFFVDDITWNDLDMDRVFKRMNPRLTTSGEQYLYYQLRTPSLSPQIYQKRKKLLELMEEKKALRTNIQLILSKLGCGWHADIYRPLTIRSRAPVWMCIHILQNLLLPISLMIWMLAGAQGFLAVLGVLTLNGIVHEYRIRKCSAEFDWVNYAVSLVYTVKSVQKLHDPMLDEYLQQTYQCLDKLRFVSRTGGVSKYHDGSLADSANTVSMLDLIAFEYLKARLSGHHGEILAMHEAIGQLDAAIAVASYRASLSYYAEPQIDFSGEKSYIQARNMYHPLLTYPVANSIHTEKPILITGSNASGKSTYLKTAALCVLLAQSICTVPAETYQASVFRIFSSMALNDDLLSGESYYIAEIKSIQRILREAKEKIPLLCTIDEVLRGTNTVERISASTEILQALAQDNLLCLAATHDGELCELLSGRYEMYHFEEKIENEDMIFDYQIHEGKAVSRNAINLLHLLGFDEEIVAGAHRRANRYMKTGKWS